MQRLPFCAIQEKSTITDFETVIFDFANGYLFLFYSTSICIPDRNVVIENTNVS